jgi:hypothetical protein
LGWQMFTNTPCYWLRWSLANFLLGHTSNYDPLDLHLPSSYNYRSEPLQLLCAVTW